MPALIAPSVGCCDVFSTICPTVTSSNDVLGSEATAEKLVAVETEALLGFGGGRTVFLKSARHGDLQRLNFESPVRKASERAPAQCAIPAVWSEEPRTVGQPCPSTASIRPPKTAQGGLPRQLKRKPCLHALRMPAALQTHGRAGITLDLLHHHFMINMLYEIEGTTTRLLGTMHIVPAGQSGWVDYVRKAYDWAEKIVVESKMSSAKAIFSAATSQPKELPDDLKDWAAARWNEENCGPLSDANLPSVALVTAIPGLMYEMGVETVIGQWMDDPETMVELESAESFAAAFSEAPAAELIGMMRRRVGNDQASQRHIEQMYRAWRGQSADKMIKLNRSVIPPATYRAMFDARNRNWAPKVRDISQQSVRTLICVGAGHLHGPNSLRELLAQGCGLTTRRVQLSLG